MDCAYHAGVPATAYCSACGRAVCQNCLVVRADRSVCPVCAAGVAQPTQPLLAQPVPQPAPAKASSAPTTTCLLIGCLALPAIAALGTVVGGYFHYRQRLIVPATPGTGPVPVPPVKGEAPVPEQKTAPAPETKSAPVRRPSEALAKQTALGQKPSWKAKVVFHTPDWQRVKVYIGPPNSGYTTSVVLQWDGAANAYRVERTEAIPKPPPPKPAGPRPSRAGAIAAAKGGDGSMVAKVVSHTADWTQATVYIGPPASEFIYAVTVQWTGRGYQIIARDSIDQPGWSDEEPAPPDDYTKTDYDWEISRKGEG